MKLHKQIKPDPGLWEETWSSEPDQCSDSPGSEFRAQGLIYSRLMWTGSSLKALTCWSVRTNMTGDADGELKSDFKNQMWRETSCVCEAVGWWTCRTSWLKEQKVFQCVQVFFWRTSFPISPLFVWLNSAVNVSTEEVGLDSGNQPSSQICGFRKCVVTACLILSHIHVFIQQSPRFTCRITDWRHRNLLLVLRWVLPPSHLQEAQLLSRFTSCSWFSGSFPPTFIKTLQRPFLINVSVWRAAYEAEHTLPGLLGFKKGKLPAGVWTHTWVFISPNFSFGSFQPDSVGEDHWFINETPAGIRGQIMRESGDQSVQQVAALTHCWAENWWSCFFFHLTDPGTRPV